MLSPVVAHSEGKLRVGVVLDPGSTPHAAFTRARLDAFCRALTQATDTSVVGVGAADYPRLLAALSSGELELAWLPPVVALQAGAIGRSLPLALPVRGGRADFHTALFAREGSAIQSAADLVGTRAAWVDPVSASGYLLIRAALRSRGVSLDRAFRSEAFHGAHEAVVRAVSGARADVGATFVHFAADGRSVRRAGWGSAHMQIVESFGPIPNDVLAAAMHVPASMIRKVQGALVGGSADVSRAAAELFEAETFIRAEPTHLAPLASLLRFLDDTAHRSLSSRPP